MYRPVVTNPEYFANWVPKFNLLCLPKAYIGFFASQFFVGVITAIYFVPRYSDLHGRLTIMILSISLQLLVQVGLLMSDNLYFAYFCMFCLGCTFPGKNIIFYNYTMEILDIKVRQQIVNFIAFVECSTLIWGTLYYQHISKNWVYLQCFCTLMSVCGLVFILLFFHESPKFLYSKGRFNEARYSIQKIA
jgi:MFS family permease